ncbi:MAG: dihydroorotate dehydrogenase-like protein [Gemmatimonadetes bacterium]|nr:dihydroorotate dehydrogenase-like protein [Gemmatimonadota bacterium]
MDLSTSYLGLDLPHPFIAGASPLTETPDGAKRIEEAGAAALVLPSLFEEQIHLESLASLKSTDAQADSLRSSSADFVEPEEFVINPHRYLDRVRRVKDAVDIPVIASLNGYTRGGWLEYARLLAEAGADALELNLYNVVTEAHLSAGELEGRSVTIVREVKERIDIPLSVKLSPFYTALPHFAGQLETAGADAIVLFNRFFESDIDVDELAFASDLQLSDPRELLLRLRWLAILSGTLETIELGVTGGVYTAEDAVKAIMSGASTVQMVSSLYEKGLSNLARIKSDMTIWMEEKECASLAHLRGSMTIRTCPDPQVLFRANYMHQIRTWDRTPS